MKILAAIDSSSESAAVISQAAARPWPPLASFEVLSVADSPESGGELTRRASALAEDGARKLAERGLSASAFVMHGHPKAAIIDRAREIGADLMLIGSRQDRFLAGGVASAVLRHAHCSVELIRAGRGPAAERKILLATDGSDHSLGAARAIASRPWPEENEVRVLTAVELSLTLFQSTLETPYLSSDMAGTQRAEAMQRAERALAAAEEVLAEAGLKTSESISVLVENPKKIILDEAAQWGAGLIFVGSHGRRGLDRFLLGSVSEAVALHASCSVEVVRIG